MALEREPRDHFVRSVGARKVSLRRSEDISERRAQASPSFPKNSLSRFDPSFFLRPFSPLSRRAFPPLRVIFIPLFLRISRLFRQRSSLTALTSAHARVTPSGKCLEERGSFGPNKNASIGIGGRLGSETPVRST